MSKPGRSSKSLSMPSQRDFLHCLQKFSSELRKFLYSAKLGGELFAKEGEDLLPSKRVGSAYPNPLYYVRPSLFRGTLFDCAQKLRIILQLFVTGSCSWSEKPLCVQFGPNCGSYLQVPISILLPCVCSVLFLQIQHFLK